MREAADQDPSSPPLQHDESALRLLDYAPPPPQSQYTRGSATDVLMKVMGNFAMLLVGMLLPYLPLIPISSVLGNSITVLYVVLSFDVVVAVLLLRSSLTRMLGISMLLSMGLCGLLVALNALSMR